MAKNLKNKKRRKAQKTEPKIEKVENQQSNDDLLNNQVNSSVKDTEMIDFKKVLDESKANLSISKDVFAKRRGRPRKPVTATLSSEPDKAQSVQQEPKINQPEPMLNVSSSEILKLPLQVIGTNIAKKYQCPELDFTKEEIEICAESIDKILNAYAPDFEKMDPKTAALLGGGMAVASIAYSKYLILQAHRASKVDLSNQNQQDKVNPLEELKTQEQEPILEPVKNEGPKVSATNYFKQQQTL